MILKKKVFKTIYYISTMHDKKKKIGMDGCWTTFRECQLTLSARKGISMYVYFTAMICESFGKHELLMKYKCVFEF